MKIIRKVSPKVSRQKGRGLKDRIGNMLMFLFFTLSIFSGYLVTNYSTASAVGAGVDKKYLAAEELFQQFPKTCGMTNFNRGDDGEKGFAKNIKSADYTDSGFWGYFGDQYITVGYSNEKLVGDTEGGSDGIVSCRATFKFLVKTLVTTERQKWLQRFYKVSEYVNDKEYANKVNDDIAKAVTEDLQASLDEIKSSNSSWNTSKTQFDTANIMDAFNKCWKFNPPAGATEKEKEKLREKKENWDLKLSGGDNAVVGAGYRVEVTVQGNYGDGNANCNDLWNWAKENNKLGANPLGNEEEAVKRVAITELLNSDPDKAMQCIKKIDMLADNDVSDAIDLFIDLLIDGVSAGDAAAYPEIAAQIEEAKECLYSEETGFGDELKGLVEEDVASNPNNNEEENGGSSGGQSDDCLSKTSQFLGWFACPVINLIDSFLEKIEDLIKNLLKFNITGSAKEGNVNQKNGLRNAWNIFRSLATILIAAGFLLALLVKAVKGE